MYRLLAMSGVLLGLNACIIYENDGDPFDGAPRFDDGEDPIGDDPTGDDPTGEETGEPDEPIDERGSSLVLTPSEASPGETLMVTVTTDGLVDLALIASVVFTIDVEVLDVNVRADGIVLLVQVAADAELGPVDVFVQTNEGDGFILDLPFAIVEGSGDGGSGGGDCN